MLEEDELLRGKYFMLDRVDVHCTWVSKAVLDLLPDDLPEEVPGGEIVREPGMGVFCDNAMDLVISLWPKPSKEKKKTFVASAMKELHKVGLVGMHDAGVTPVDITMYDEMSRTEDWTLRVYSMLECPERNTFCPDEAAKVEHPDGMFSVRSVKLFADGALGSWGSAMIEPYSDRPDTSGSLLVNASTLTSLARSWSAAGFQVNIHAIGDLANRLAIDALEASLRGLCSEDHQNLAACQSRHRFRIEHSQIIHPADQKRMHDIGIIPSIQPTHATSDMAYAALRLGEERTRTEAYRMRSLLDISPILGSDFPVEPPNPFEGIYAAVTRKNPHTGTGPPGYEQGWHVEEALTVEQALDGFTRSVARGAFLDGKAGVIREGAFADWVVLDEDIFGVGKEELRGLRVRETWVGGRGYMRGSRRLGGRGRICERR
ncbi:amidohydrolase 3 [Chaetomium sp. MPI-CAGE-AT-0009]|nr:amidohydrolase 3 [Chaetomium sp. MPI-CAGE-AT-0009]